jgi:hypothetical protein
MNKPSLVSVEIGNDDLMMNNQEVSTDVRNLVDFSNFGCNTHMINTDEK